VEATLEMVSGTSVSLPGWVVDTVVAALGTAQTGHWVVLFANSYDLHTEILEMFLLDT
jgi:hypothetical protein